MNTRARDEARGRRAAATGVALLALLAVAAAPDALRAQDADGDGIRDALDRCPDAPETLNGHMDRDGCPDSVATLLDLAARDVDRYWAAELGRVSPDVPYRPPAAVRPYTSEVATPCGPARAGNAFYCGSDRAIYLDLRFLSREFRRGDFAPVVVLAHEWGHVVQDLLGWRDELAIRHELQADCYAGAFAHHADTAGSLEPGDREEAMHSLFAAGSTDILWLDPAAHGSGGQRIDAFTWGFENAARACTERVFLGKVGGPIWVFPVPDVPGGSLAQLVPPGVGPFKLVDVWRARNLIGQGVTDAARGKYRRDDGALVWNELIALRGADARRRFFEHNVARFQEQGFVLLGSGDVRGEEEAIVGRYAQFRREGRDIWLWTNRNVAVFVSGPSTAARDFARWYPL